MAKAAQRVVSDREKSTAKVVRTARRCCLHRPRAGQAPGSRARRRRRDARPRRTSGAAGSALERRFRRLLTADDVLTERERQDTVLRARRDISVDLLHRGLGDLRNVVANRLDREIARMFLPLKGETAREPMALLRQTDRAVERLRDFTESPHTARFCDAERERYAAPLAKQAEALRRHDAQVRRSAKGLDLARMDRRQALEEFNQVFIKVAQWFEHTYLAIDRGDLADAVKPSRQYPGRTVAEIRERTATEVAPAVEAEPEPVSPPLPFDPLRHIARALGFRLSPKGNRREASGRR